MFSIFIMKNFKYIEKLKEFYSEYWYIHHLDSIINILLYFIAYIFTFLSFYPSVNSYFVHAF